MTADANSCQLAPFSDKPCDGRLVRAHLIPKRVLRQVWRSQHELAPNQFLADVLPARLDQLIWDERTFVMACGGPTGVGGHHGELDHARTLKVPRSAIPDGTEQIAKELGLVWWLDREYGERDGRR